MAYVKELAPGFRFGLGTISADATAGQCVVVSDANEFSVNDDATARVFGILADDYDEDDRCGVHCLGGIYETDAYTGDITAGDALACDAETALLRTLNAEADPAEFQVAEAISVVSGVLRFKLLV
jgi:hypothetical protein